MDSYSKDSQRCSFEKTQESEEKSDSRKATVMLSQGAGTPQVLHLTVLFSELSCLQVHARPNRKGVCRSVRLCLIAPWIRTRSTHTLFRERVLSSS